MSLPPLELRDAHSKRRASRFSVACASCHFERVIGVEVLEQLGEREADLADAVRRIRCSRCGGRRVEVQVVTGG